LQYGIFRCSIEKQIADIEKEARSQTVVLEDDDPEILGLMLDFCYGETLEIICQRLPEKSPAALRARLFQVADKYDIPALKGDVESWFEGNEWKDSASSDKREALGLIYQMPPSTTESLRTLALKSLRLHLGFMVTKESFQSVIATQPLMAVDILSLLGRRDIGIPLAWSKCQSCDKKFAVEGPSYDKQHAKMPGPKVCPYCVTYLPEKEEVHEEYYL